MLEEIEMQFKRKEAFRLAFDPPIDITFKLLSGGKPNGAPSFGKIIDISPRGMKLFSEVTLEEQIVKRSQVEVHFVLDTQTIHAYGEIIWRRPFGKGYHYGLHFYNQPSLEELIISELKSRRKKEVADAKKKL